MDLLTDLRFALRAFRKAPGFTAVAVVSLGVGIGVAATAFSMVNAVHFRPVPHVNTNRLVLLFEHHPVKVCQGCRFGVSYPDYLDWRAQATSFEDLAAEASDQFVVSGDGRDAQRIRGAYVSRNLFPLLGVQPSLGRLFREEEDRVGGDPVVVISHALWQDRFGGRPDVLGRSLTVTGRQHVVIGVMPPGFLYPATEHLWLPLAPMAHGKPRDEYLLGVAGRLGRSVTLDAARLEMQTIAARLAGAYPATNDGWTVHVRSFRDVMIEDYTVASTASTGLVVSVLLVAFANLATLLLSRSSSRAKEMAVRAAIGASRWRLIRIVLSESIAVSGLGGLLGLLLAGWGVRLAARLPPDTLPFWMEITVDLRVVAVAVLVTMAAGLLFGLAPALHASRVDLHASLRGGAPGARRPAVLRTAFVVGELALALTLVTAATMMGQALLRMGAMDRLGYDPRQVLQGTVSLTGPRYPDDASITAAVDRLLERMTAGPHVRQAAARAIRVDFSDRPSIRLDGRGENAEPAPNIVFAITSDYFDVLGIPMQRGRGFTGADRMGAEPVAIVTGAMAQRFWPGEEALGRRFKLGSLPWLTIVGVAGDTVGSPYSGRLSEQPFVPMAQVPIREITIFAKTDADVAAALSGVRTAVRLEDPDLPVEGLSPLDEALRAWTSPIRVMTWFAAAMAAFAIGLSALGLYGVVSFAVTARRREIGIRLAVGAAPGHVVRLFLRHAAMMSGMGLCLGAIGGYAATQVVAATLPRVEAAHPPLMGAVGVLLAAVILLACYWPARLASRVDPVEVLRPE